MHNCTSGETNLQQMVTVNIQCMHTEIETAKMMVQVIQTPLQTQQRLVLISGAIYTLLVLQDITGMITPAAVVPSVPFGQEPIGGH